MRSLSRLISRQGVWWAVWLIVGVLRIALAYAQPPLLPPRPHPPAPPAPSDEELQQLEALKSQQRIEVEDASQLPHGPEWFHQPGGSVIHASCAWQVPEGEFVDFRYPGRMIRADGSTYVIKPCPYPSYRVRGWSHPRLTPPAPGDQPPGPGGAR